MSYPIHFLLDAAVDQDGLLILPPNARALGRIDLHGCRFVNRLPNDLDVDELDLRDSTIIELPRNLTVTTNLDIRNTAIQELPADLRVGLRIIYSKPDGTSIELSGEALNSRRGRLYE